MKIIFFLSGLVVLDSGIDAILRIFPLTLILTSYILCVLDVIFLPRLVKRILKK